MTDITPLIQVTALLDPVVEIARRAGQSILEIYHSDDFGVETKADDSPLTRADLAAHRTILAGLEALQPRLPILSEEDSDMSFDVRSNWQEYWLVDPLDGTKEFIKRNGEFTVNIALIQQGYPVLGVVHVPVTKRTYMAADGAGCFVRENDNDANPIQVRALGSGAVTVVGSRSHASARVQSYLERLGEHQLTAMGSSLKFCLVAEGLADLYPRLGLTSEWDTAAAQCVVEQAGGQVTDTAMNRLRYNTKDSLLNPDFLVFGDASRDWNAYL